MSDPKIPAFDMAAFLNSLPDLTLTAVVGEFRHDGTIPDDAIFVGPGTGRGPQRRVSSNKETRFVPVHVRVRHTSLQQGTTECARIRDALAEAHIDGYFDIEAGQSDFASLGQDQDGRYRWTCSFIMKWVNDI